MLEDAFYLALLDLRVLEYIHKGNNLLDSYDLAKEELKLEYDEKGKYTGKL